MSRFLPINNINERRIFRYRNMPEQGQQDPGDRPPIIIKCFTPLSRGGKMFVHSNPDKKQPKNTINTFYHGYSYPALVYGRVFARAGYDATRKRWAQAD
jgi:hypothetical protein